MMRHIASQRGPANMSGPAKLWWLSCCAYRKKRIVLAKVYKAVNYVLYKCLLPFEAQMEPDIHLDHYALAVVMHPNVKIGHRVRIYHHVTLASETWVGSPYGIVIGDDVTIGVGAIVVARPDTTLTIGNGATVGAGAVVTGDVAPGAVMVGVPARPLIKKPTEKQI